MSVCMIVCTYNENVLTSDPAIASVKCYFSLFSPYLGLGKYLHIYYSVLDC